MIGTHIDVWRRLVALGLVWVAVLGPLVIGCGDDLAAPDTGAIEVTTITTGESPDPDGYLATLDGDLVQPIGTDATIEFTGLMAGNHTIGLTDLDPNCTVGGENPLTAPLTAGGTTQVTFVVACPTARSGVLEVTSTTAGDATDPDGYMLFVDGGQGIALGTNSTLTLSEVSQGEHRLRLGGVAPNCSVAGPNPRTVEVFEGSTARTSFEVECTPPVGRIEITATTTGVSQDQDGYAVSLDREPALPIPANGTLAFTGLTPGDHQVGLTGLAPNCTLAGENPRAVSVVNGESSQVTFRVSCLPTGPGTILFSSDRSGLSHLYRMQADGSGIVDLTPSAEAFDGDWSPDGSRIVFTATADEEFGVFVMNADGSDPVPLGISGGGVRWSPDGQSILFVSGGTFTTDATIQVMNADGSGVRVLTTGRRPDWSPDGTTIAFQRVGQCVADICGASIYLMAADGSQVRRLTGSGSAFEFSGGPAWSPDGATIAFERHALFGGSGFYLMNRDGSGIRVLTSRSGEGRPVWSPDGSAILVPAFSSDGGSTVLLVLPGRGGAGAVLATSPGSEQPQSWK
jgi:Tol biopolymer transport system component